MKKKVLYFVDEEEVQRRSCGDVLSEMFRSSELTVEAIGPRVPLSGYAELVARPDTAGFILDQRLGTTGLVPYTGIELAQFLRGLDTKIPIVILTNFSSDDFGRGACAVEYIARKQVLRDPSSAEALEFKERLVRHINVFDNITSERARRYHELLLKSLATTLSAEEKEELRRLSGERVAAIAGVESDKQQELDKEIAHLKRLLEEL